MLVGAESFSIELDVRCSVLEAWNIGRADYRDIREGARAEDCKC